MASELHESCVLCGRPARYRGMGLCDAHWTRQKRGKPMSGPIATRNYDPWRRLTEAALAYAAAETETQLDSAGVRLRRAADAYREVRENREAA